MLRKYLSFFISRNLPKIPLNNKTLTHFNMDHFSIPNNSKDKFDKVLKGISRNEFPLEDNKVTDPFI